MTKVELADRIQEQTLFNRKESFEMLEAVLEVVKSTLERGESVKVSGFGNFEVKEKKDRKGRNPQTGEAITIDARRVLTFKPSGVLKTEMNR